MVLSTVEVLTRHRINAHFSITGQSNCLLCSPVPTTVASLSTAGSAVWIRRLRWYSDDAPKYVQHRSYSISTINILYKEGSFILKRGGVGGGTLVASSAALSLLCGHLVIRYMSVCDIIFFFSALQNDEHVSVMLTA